MKRAGMKIKKSAIFHYLLYPVEIIPSASTTFCQRSGELYMPFWEKSLFLELTLDVTQCFSDVTTNFNSDNVRFRIK